MVEIYLSVSSEGLIQYELMLIYFLISRFSKKLAHDVANKTEPKIISPEP